MRNVNKINMLDRKNRDRKEGNAKWQWEERMNRTRAEKDGI